MPLEIDINILKLGNRTLFENFHLRVNEGEITAIAGPNGSGKSVLLGIITGYYPNRQITVEGTININGKSFKLCSDSEYLPQASKRIRLFFQDPLSCFDPQQKIGFYFKKYSPEEYNCLFEEFQLGEPEKVLTLYPHEISHGMAQRIWFIHALLTENDYYFFDEAFDSLDSKNKKIFINKILELKLDKKGILLVTHDSSILEEYVDNLINLE